MKKAQFPLSYSKETIFLALRFDREDEWDGGSGAERWPWTCCVCSCVIWAAWGLWLLRTSGLQRSGLLCSSSDSYQKGAAGLQQLHQKEMSVRVCSRLCIALLPRQKHNTSGAILLLIWEFCSCYQCLSAKWRPGYNNGPFIINDLIRNGAYFMPFAGWLMRLCVLDKTSWRHRPLESRHFYQGTSFWLVPRASGLHFRTCFV